MDELILNDCRYRVVRPLGSPGFIAQAYLAEALDFATPEMHVVLKTPSPMAISEQTAIERLRSEAAVLKTLNTAEVPQWAEVRDAPARASLALETAARRTIIAGLDEGETAYQGWKYCVVQELAPGEIQLFPITGLDAELRALMLAMRLATAVDTAHKADIALQDFEPNTKIDRLHAAWENGELVNFKVIDWNISGGRPEIPNDVIFLNALVFALFTGYFPILVEKAKSRDFAPFEPAKATRETWMRLSPATRILLDRLVHPLPTVRPASAAAVLYELKWLRDLLTRQASLLPADWVTFARNERERPVHVLMVAATAQPKLVSSSFWSDLASLEKTAQRELIAGEERVLRKIEDNLKYGVFNEAQRLLEESLPKITHEEIARQLRYRQQQIEFALTQLKRGESPLTSLEYQRLQDAVTAMVAAEWQKADVFLAVLPKEDRSVSALRAVVAWHLRHDGFKQQIEGEHIYRIEEDASWERERLTRLREVLHDLDRLAFQALGVEPALDVQAAWLNQHIHYREVFLEFLSTAPKYLESERETVVQDTARQRLRHEPADARAAHLIAEATLSLELRRCVAEAQTALTQGRYEAACATLENLQKPPELLDKAFKRLSEQFKVIELKEKARVLQGLQTQAQQELVALESRDIALKAPKLAALILSPEEKTALEEWELIVRRAQHWLGRHQDRNPVLPDASVAEFTELHKRVKEKRVQFLGARLDALADALDRFTEEVVAAAPQLLENLEKIQANDRFKSLQARFEKLKDQYLAGENALDERNLDAALQVFRAVAEEPAVAESQRASVRGVLTWWNAIQSNIEAPFIEPDLLAPLWPGTKDLYKLMKVAISGELIREADVVHGNENWRRAVDLYQLAEQYAPLAPVASLRYAQAKKYTALIEKVDTADNLQVDNKSNGDLKNQIDSLLEAWEQGKGRESLRDKIEGALESRLWAILPEQPLLENLAECRTCFEIACRKTGKSSWRQAVISLEQAEQFLTIKKDLDLNHWDVQDKAAYPEALKKWIAGAKTAAYQLKLLDAGSTPPQLRRLLGDWQQALAEMLENSLEIELETIEANRGEYVPDSLDEILEQLQVLSDLLPDSLVKLASVKRLTALVNQTSEQKAAQELIARLNECVVNQGDILNDAEFNEAELKIKGDSQLDSVKRLRWINSAQRVLNEAATADTATYALRLDALRATSGKCPQSSTPSAVETRIEELKKSLEKKAEELSVELKAETRSAFDSLKKQVAAVVIEDATVEKVVELLWQYAWDGKSSDPNVPPHDPVTGETYNAPNGKPFEPGPVSDGVLGEGSTIKSPLVAGGEQVIGAKKDVPKPGCLRGAWNSLFRRGSRPKSGAELSSSSIPILEPPMSAGSNSTDVWLDKLNTAIHEECKKLAPPAGDLAFWCRQLAAEIYRRQVSVAMACGAKTDEELKELRKVVKKLKEKPKIELPGKEAMWHPDELGIFDSRRLAGTTDGDFLLDWKRSNDQLQIVSDAFRDQVATKLAERAESLKTIIRKLGFRYIEFWESKPSALAMAHIVASWEQSSAAGVDPACLAEEREMAILESEYLSSLLRRTICKLAAAQQTFRDARDAEQKMAQGDPHKKVEDIKDARGTIAGLPPSLYDNKDVQWLSNSGLQSWWQAQRSALEEKSLELLVQAVYNEYMLHRSPEKIPAICASLQPGVLDQVGRRAFELALIAGVKGVHLAPEDIVRQARDA